MNSQSIRLVSRTDIDVNKWDQCINLAPNGLIYAYSIYLDTLADNWEALVAGDYESVMPIPFRRKWGIKYAYHPVFVQQLGIFGKLSSSIEQQFVQYLSSYIKFGDFFFNYKNEWISKNLPVTPLTNFTLNLSRGYDEINSSYSKDLRSNLKRATKMDLTYVKEDDLNISINLFKAQYQYRIPNLKESDYKSFAELSSHLHSKSQAFSRKVMDKDGKILAIGLFLKDHGRIYNLMNTTNREGRNYESNHYLLDNLIKEFSTLALILDFEGSDLPGVKSFYESFAPTNCPYFHYRHNTLPWPLTIFR
jgi:hypothetical protein